MAQTVTVTGVNDFVDDGHIAYTIVTNVQSADPLYAAINPADVQVANLDNDLTVAILGAPSSSPEGTAVALTSSVSDFGSAASFDYYWSVTKNGAPFATGTSADFAFTPDDQGSYVVTLSATGNEGSSGAAQAGITVTNVAPTATLVAPTAVNESSVFTVALSNPTDPSDADTAAGFHYAFAMDGESLATATYANSGASAAASFAFDDGPSDHTITVRIFDKDGSYTDHIAAIHVNNVAPTAALAGPSSGVPGQVQTFLVSATDPSDADTVAGFVYTINWGDGTPEETSAGDGSGVSVGHVYATAGSYTVTVIATDKDGGASSPATGDIAIAGVGMQGSTLVVGGTMGDDNIDIHPGGGPGGILATLNEVEYGPFTGVTRLEVYGMAGNDNIAVRGNVNVPVLLDGGDGNDRLRSGAGPATILGGNGDDDIRVGRGAAYVRGGAGNDFIKGGDANDVLLGGDGNDTLIGGKGRDLLIGGLGADLLRGGKGDDLLIGGTTDFDDDKAALDAILAEWARTDTRYRVRIGHLRDGSSGGLNGPYRLNAMTVHDDAAIDELWGESGSDWFFALTSGPSADKLDDLSGGENVTPL